MKIKVEVKNKILGDSVFWEGDEKDISQIRNTVAFKMAESIIRDGRTRNYGMWHVSEVKED